jgi:hypothetical protein
MYIQFLCDLPIIANVKLAGAQNDDYGVASNPAYTIANMASGKPSEFLAFWIRRPFLDYFLIHVGI